MSSQLTLEADIAQYGRHFAFVPQPDIGRTHFVEGETLSRVGITF